MIDYLTDLAWSGNVRELENFIERIVAIAPVESEIVDHEHLPPDHKKVWKTHTSKPVDIGVSLFHKTTQFEADVIRKSLQNHNWNQARAARELDVSEATIRYKMKKLNIKKTVKPEKI
jgi:transcriptional regulator with PAS, ATPase and Fis domain